HCGLTTNKIKGGTKYPWASARIIALFVVLGVLIIVFAAIQIWKQDDATVPPRILLQRSILASSVFAFSLGASFFIWVYFIPIWFQAIKGTSAVRSGIDNLPMILSVVVSSLISGAVISATGYYAPWMIVGSVLASVGAGMISTFEPGTSTGQVVSAIKSFMVRSELSSLLFLATILLRSRLHIRIYRTIHDFLSARDLRQISTVAFLVHSAILLHEAFRLLKKHKYDRSRHIRLIVQQA
ncbi:hypothetical protein MPER_03716, partial [Moniliophthora perniciosa FA553]